MRWDNVVALYLIAAFLVFITLRGELPVYMGFLLSPASVPAKTPQQSVDASTPAALATLAGGQAAGAFMIGGPVAGAATLAAGAAKMGMGGL